MHTAKNRRSACLRIARLLSIVGVLFIPATVRADTPAAPFPGCTTGVLPSGAYSLVCLPIAGVTGPPTGWNHGFIVYAHGYINFDEPLQLLPDGTTIPLLALSQGFGFATTSFRQNGLAILEGMEDITELMETLASSHGQLPTYMVGGSEGALVATLLVEQSEQFIGGLAACGPIGTFRGQIDYFGDFRVLFDYYFPNVIPGQAVSIPHSVIENWYARYYDEIWNALIADPVRTDELLRVAHVTHPFDPANPVTFAVQATFVLDLLRYNIFGTNDAFKKLGGHSFDNRDREYMGSSDDNDLNRHVHRFKAQKNALAAVQAYETSGDLHKPLVTLHTTGDHVIPYGLHEPRYFAKVQSNVAGSFLGQHAVANFGHCTFAPADILNAFADLRTRAGF